MIRHIWFDLAGTLYRETPAFNELHDQFRFETYANLKGITDPGVAKQEYLDLYKQHGSNSAVFLALGQPSDYWMQALESMDFKSVLRPDPIVTNTLQELANRVPISLFTNFMRQRITELLTHLEIKPELFAYILSGDDIVERKPALDGFHTMIARSNLPPEHIMYVGDRVDVDIKPAKQLGMKTALIYSQSDEADYSLTRFNDLLSLEDIE